MAPLMLCMPLAHVVIRIQGIFYPLDSLVGGIHYT